MEIKKSQKADLESRKSLFLEIGLCASLLLMIGAFAWGADKKELSIVTEPEQDWVATEEIDQTVQEMQVPQMATPAQTLSVLTDRIQIVDNETRIETNLEFADFEENMVFNANPTSGTEIQGTEWPDFFEKVEFMPQFQGGGVDKFRSWVNGRMNYPPTAQEMGLEGTVKVEFMVMPDGSVGEVAIVSNSERLFNNEVLRVVRSSPKWTPGRQGNIAVKVKHKMDITFRLPR